MYYELCIMHCRLNSRDIFHSLHRLDLLYYGGEHCIVGDSEGKVALEESVVGIHLDVAQRGLGLFAYDGGDVGYDADVVLPYDTELYG